MTKSPAQIIEEKGGAAKFAAAVGKRPGAVRQWKKRAHFPRTAWPEIIEAYPDLTMDVLQRVEREAAA